MAPRKARDCRNNSVTSFAEQGEYIWIGTFDGLNRWNGSNGRFDLTLGQVDGLADDMVMALATRGDELWVGTMSGGVNLIRDGEVIDHFEHEPLDPTTISGNAVSDILVDDRDRVWLTTWGGGVSQYLGEGRFERYPDPSVSSGGFSDLRAVAIEQAPDGRLWVATDGGGVVILDPETGRTEALRYRPDDPAGLSSDNVISLRYAAETMWVGTRDRGLNRYQAEHGEFIRYTKTDGLASDAVYGILEDHKRNLWISGGKGLSVLNPETGEFTTYDATHGLQSDDFNSGAFLKLADGSFLFGGNNGFNAFDPALIKGNTFVPPIVVTEFTKFNEPVSLPDKPIFNASEIELAYDDFVIGFEFSAMDFTAPEKNRYQYKLEGFDRDWVDAKPGARQVTYTNLDPGSYRFRVRGSNNDGVWNLEGASVDVAMSPPLWATWWAYLGYLGLGLIALYQVQKANERRLRRDAEKALQRTTPAVHRVTRGGNGLRPDCRCQQEFDVREQCDRPDSRPVSGTIGRPLYFVVTVYRYCRRQPRASRSRTGRSLARRGQQVFATASPSPPK
ncbi:MAG: triple tyrosine motif-containing protein [Gammaproteobacteria bacterium]|nr:triple tyrosine motif-containing protein [Gammaproteobacteria bacterium]